MTAIQVRPGLSIQQVADILDSSVSPRRYWLHNRIGGTGWEIRFGSQGLYQGRPVTLEVTDPALATFVSLLVS
jgi:hypothetical protein